MSLEAKSVTFFVSSVYHPETGRGGVATVVRQLCDALPSSFQCEVIAIFGTSDPEYNQEQLVICPWLTHRSDAKLWSKIWFWVVAVLFVTAFIARNHRKFSTHRLISCSPGCSFVLPFFFRSVVIWENVAFFAKRKCVDYYRLRLMSMLGATVVVPTHEELDTLGKRFPSLKLIYCNDWYDENSLTRKRPEKAAVIRFLAAGMFERRRGFDLLVDAVAKLPDSYRARTAFTILGDGPCRPDIEILIKIYGLSQHFTLPGVVPQPYDYFEHNDVFILPSRFEGFPLVMVNALAAGLPVVAFNCRTGPSEIIEDGKNGLLVPPNSAEELMKAIKSFIDGLYYTVDAEVCRSSARKFGLEEAVAIWDTKILA